MSSGAWARTHLAVWLVYTLLALLLTWPTVTHPATYLPGDGGDDPAIAWNLWWVKQALLVERTNPLLTDFMFYPLGINLAFYTLTALNALTAMPLTLTLGVVVASNLHMGFTFIVGGYGTFLLARHVLAHTFGPQAKSAGTMWAAAMAGGFYAFAGSQLFYVSLGQFNIASSHWVPYTVLFVLKSRRHIPAAFRLGQIVKNIDVKITAKPFVNIAPVWFGRTHPNSFILLLGNFHGIFQPLFVHFIGFVNIKNKAS